MLAFPLEWIFSLAEKQIEKEGDDEPGCLGVELEYKKTNKSIWLRWAKIEKKLSQSKDFIIFVGILYICCPLSVFK